METPLCLWNSVFRHVQVACVFGKKKCLRLKTGSPSVRPCPGCLLPRPRRDWPWTLRRGCPSLVKAPCPSFLPWGWASLSVGNAFIRSSVSASRVNAPWIVKGAGFSSVRPLCPRCPGLFAVIEVLCLNACCGSGFRKCTKSHRPPGKETKNAFGPPPAIDGVL